MTTPLEAKKEMHARKLDKNVNRWLEKALRDPNTLPVNLKAPKRHHCD